MRSGAGSNGRGGVRRRPGRRAKTGPHPTSNPVQLTATLGQAPCVEGNWAGLKGHGGGPEIAHHPGVGRQPGGQVGTRKESANAKRSRGARTQVHARTNVQDGRREDAYEETHGTERKRLLLCITGYGKGMFLAHMKQM